MSVDQNKRKSSLRLDQRSMLEIERRLSALEGLGQQTIRYGTKIRGVRQGATWATDLMRKGEWTIDGKTGNLVILDVNGQLVDSGYSPTELLGTIGGGDTVASAISAYRAISVQQISNSAWTKVQFNGEIYDLGGEFFPDTNAWTKVADQLGVEIAIMGLVEYNGKLYGCTNTNGILYEWNDVDAWVAVTGAVGTVLFELCVYDNSLYAASNDGKLYVWNDADAWVEAAGAFGEPIMSLCVYNDKLYGGTGTLGKLVEWNDVDTWVEKAPQLNAQADIISLCVYGDALYGGTSPNGRLFVWNDVNAWTQVAPQLGAATQIYGLLVHNGGLYGGTYPNGNLYKWNDVNAWQSKAGQLLGQTYIRNMVEYFGSIYGGTLVNAMLFKWNGSDAWIQKAAQLNTETWIAGLAVYNEKIYGGSGNAAGELYEIEPREGEGQFIADVLGKYFIHATIAFTNTNIAANRHIIAAIYKNGSEIARSTLQTAYANEVSIDVMTETELTQGSYIEIYVWHDMGNICEIEYGIENTHLEVRRVDNLLCGLGDNSQCILLTHAHPELDDYYTKVQLDAGQLDTIYFQESEFLNASAGAGDAGKPIVLDADGDIDATMINSADVNHDATTSFVGNEHVDHSGVSVIAGTLLTGGGAITTSVTLNVDEASIDHDSIAGLGDDDHSQYALLAGRSGGQILIGGQDSGDNLTLQSTAHATKGSILFGTSAYDEANNRLGLNVAVPLYRLHIQDDANADILRFDESKAWLAIGDIANAYWAANSPMAPLHVIDDAGAMVCLERTDVGNKMKWNWIIDSTARLGFWAQEFGTQYMAVQIANGNYTVPAIHAQTAAVGINTDSPDRTLHVERSTSYTNAVYQIMRITHVSSNTPVAGFGAEFEFELEENDGTNKVAGILECLWTDAGETTSADADMVGKLMENDGAAAERWRSTGVGGHFKIPGDFYSGGNQGLSGTLTLDDGANWNVALTFVGGILTGQAIGASTGATATWA